MENCCNDQNTITYNMKHLEYNMKSYEVQNQRQ